MDETSQYMVLILNGLSIGGAYAILGLSINVVYYTSKIINFAQGDLMMLGAMLAVTFYTFHHLPYGIVVAIVVGSLVVVGLATDVLIVRPLRRRHASVLSVVVATIGLDITLPIIAEMIWGQVEQHVPSPFGTTPIHLGVASITPQDLFILAAVIVTLGLAWLFFTRTTLGVAMRATAMAPDGARLVGINVNRVITLSFAASAGLAGWAGLLLVPLSYASPWSGLGYAVAGFTAAIVGGLGSLPGAVLGGVLLGVFQSVVFTLTGNAWGNELTLAFMIAVLYIRPEGFLGVKEELRP